MACQSGWLAEQKKKKLPKPKDFDIIELPTTKGDFMKQDFYMFEYSTKTKRHKLISYGAFSLESALKRFKKNVRLVELHNVWRNGTRMTGVSF